MIGNIADADSQTRADRPVEILVGLFGHSPEPVLLAAPDDGRLLAVNPAFSRLSGHESPATVGLTLSGLFTDSVAIELLREVAAARGCERDGMLLQTRSGPVPVDLRAHLMESDSGPVLLILMHNVSAYLRKTEKSQTSGECFRPASETTVESLWDWNIVNGRLYFSPAMSTMLGYNETGIETGFKSFLRRAHPKDVNQLYSAYRSLLSGSADRFEVEFRIRHPQGHYLHIRCNGYAARDEQGRIVRVVGTCADVSERKRTDRLLKLNERRFRTLYDDSPSMFFMLDGTGKIISVNRFGAGHLGTSVEAMLDRMLIDYVHTDDREFCQDELKKCLEIRSRILRIEFRLAHQFGEPIWVRAAMRSIVYDNQRAVLVICEDISEARILSKQLEHQAMHDSLTGLINRSEFERRLRRVLMHTTDTTEHALCYLDLDQFKIVNDTCGHLAGDELLRRLGDLLNTVVRKRDTLARLGGDEFAVLLEHCPFYKAREIAENLLDTVRTFRFDWQDKHFTLGVSIGLVPITRESGAPSDILSMADSACYAAKDAGRNRVHIYHVEDSELSMRRSEMHWVSEISHALEQDRFLLALQPIVNLQPAAGQTEGKHYEVLVRMQEKNGDLIMPGSFLPAAEKYNLSGKVDQWVIDQVFHWLLNDPLELDALHLCSINLSGVSVSNPYFTNHLVDKLKLQPQLARKICFELTETAAIINLGHAIKFMNTMKELGCSFSLDDFGTGLSSFSYLKNLPVDFLKIDGSFIRNIVHDPIDQSMVHSIHEIGRVMGKATIAEFVENDAIRKILEKIGINYAQGYAIGRPVLLCDMNK